MKTIHSWQMTAPDQPLEQVAYEVPEPAPEEALIEVAGCGVCHTDLSFWHYGVPTRHALPLTLGHEISGTVLEGPSEWEGKSVVVPAVLPCGECDLCRKGRSNICQHQKMPGNDFHGGFASHVVVPARFLCAVPSAVLQSHTLAECAVVADAVSTSYQVIQKSGLQPGDFAIVIGVGGVGIYTAQLARLQEATVLAIDISEANLDRLAEVGIEHRLNIRDLSIKEAKQAVKSIAQEIGVPRHSWKIFEVSGTRAGQELAYALLGVAGTLSIVGFTLEKLEIRLSNLMAYDARVIGTWGCRPELYPEVLNLIGTGAVKIKPFIETVPMSNVNQVFQDFLAHNIHRRPILTPDFA
jgi:6-hydroxycyclohex-1-ene-1-carbonyl-CoA dehydrogenase